MKDLKHIHFFEELLEQANNSLVQQAKADEKTAVGYTCYYVPEALLNCAGAFSVRLRAPNTGSLDISQYYMNSFICGYTRALFERAFEGGYNFLDFYASSDTCQQMVRVVENIHELGLIENERAPLDGMLLISCPLRLRASLRYPIAGARSVLEDHPENPRVTAAKAANSIHARNPIEYLRVAPPYIELLRLIREARGIAGNARGIAIFSDDDEIVSPRSAEYLSGFSILTAPDSGHFLYSPAAQTAIAESLFEFIKPSTAVDIELTQR